MAQSKPGAPFKPQLTTKFHIDYDWWEKSDQDLHTYMLTHLPSDLRERFEDGAEEQVVDYVDPETGEVSQLDALGLALQEAAAREDFINPQTSLVDSVFRVFLANGNTPRSPQELEDETGRDARTILKTIGGIRIYRGIRPVEMTESTE